MVTRTAFKEDKAREAAGKGHMDATALVEYLVGRGVPFREAHRIVGRTVREAAARGASLSELTLLELRAFSDVIAEDVFHVLGVANCIENYRSHGSSSPAEVEKQLARWKEALKDVEAR